MSVFAGSALAASGATGQGGITPGGVTPGRVTPGGAAGDAVTGGVGRVEENLSGTGWHLWVDSQAEWKDDALFLPPVDLTKIPANAPTGGWDRLAAQKSIDVSVPGTVEEYQSAETPEGKHGTLGVSWWWRTIHIPESASVKSAAPSRFVLKFGAARQRAEVYLDRQLVGYDCVGNSPFEVDLTPYVKPGRDYQLAVRVTNPGGGFTSSDTTQLHWGKYLLPSSHGFGGIIGDVKLVATCPVFIDDIYVQNQPALTSVKAFLTIENTTPSAARRDVKIRVVEKASPTVEIWHGQIRDQALAPGADVVAVDISAPGAKAWDLEHPNLYRLEARLVDGGASGAGGDVVDESSQTFGFRWFAPVGVGEDAMFRLNGRRIVLRTAISWGYWPFNGIFPTPELAEKQIKTAKDFGMNMLNFHRCIGAPIVLDKADEMGLLYFEEPGGYTTGGKDPFARAVAREKLMRMVKRDRGHPSLVIYNMINEQWDRFGADKDRALFALQTADLHAAHDLDPSRTITYASAWSRAEADQPAKLHMRPFDDVEYHRGWFDYHHAGGPMTWEQNLYRGPTDFYNYTTDKKEIVYWGEEGAMSSPSRLGTIKAAVDAAAYKGFDGATWSRWHDETADFLKQSKFDSIFPTVDDFCAALGAVSLEHQGRKIELIRLSNIADGYCINGWEDTLDDNHSGVVDCWRNPKADPAIMAYYNQPLYIAVESRNLVAQAGSNLTVDFFAINEVNLAGGLTLRVGLSDADGRQTFTKDLPVTLKGGDVYGQLLAEAVIIPATGRPGMQRLTAALLDSSGATKATGREDVLTVDWKDQPVTGAGAIYEWGHGVDRFLKSRKNASVPAFDGTQGKLDWLVVARPAFERPEAIPAENFVDANGKPSGIQTTFFKGDGFETQVGGHAEATLDFSCPAGAAPDPSVGSDQNYSVRWEGFLLPPATGAYHFELRAEGTGPTKLWINGQQALTLAMADHDVFTRVNLSAGKPVSFRVDFGDRHPGGMVRLEWSPPDQDKLDPEKILARARDDGTTILFIDYADTWMPILSDDHLLRYNGRITIGGVWTGGQYFNKPHALLADLPAGGAMSWPYESVVKAGRGRYALKLSGVDSIAGAWQSQPFDFGTALATAPCGKGKLVISTLDICSNLASDDGPAQTARKLLCNYLQFAAAGK